MGTVRAVQPKEGEDRGVTLPRSHRRRLQEDVKGATAGWTKRRPATALLRPQLRPHIRNTRHSPGGSLSWGPVCLHLAQRLCSNIRLQHGALRVDFAVSLALSLFYDPPPPTPPHTHTHLVFLSHLLLEYVAPVSGYKAFLV